MLRRALVIAACLSITSFSAGTAMAQSAARDLKTVFSPYPVKETLDRLTAALAAKGIQPVARVDHSAAATRAGLTLPPAEVMMFGNPALGTPLIAAKRTVGLDLPMRVLAWQDAAGKTWVTYQLPEALKRRHAIKGQAEPIAKMTAALSGFVAEAVKPAP